MKHLLIAIFAVLSVLPREQFVSSTTGCPRRYLRRINGKCYYFSVKKMNWYGALNNCLRKGLTLADLSNPKDFYGAIDFLSSKGNTEDFWFGGNDLQTEGRFQYISNGRLVKYYGNYSMVEPAEHSECDDCLEVRIRTNMTVVADDNCLERQYFICSERYCDEVNVKKPRHHSHEHLHHFHHDIGEPSDEIEQDLNTPSPFDSVSDENDTNKSDEDALPDDDSDERTTDAKTGMATKIESPGSEEEGVEVATEEAIVRDSDEDSIADGETTAADERNVSAEEATTPAASEKPALATEEPPASADEDSTTAAAEDEAPTTAASEEATSEAASATDTLPVDTESEAEPSSTAAIEEEASTNAAAEEEVSTIAAAEDEASTTAATEEEASTTAAAQEEAPAAAAAEEETPAP